MNDDSVPIIGPEPAVGSSVGDPNPAEQSAVLTAAESVPTDGSSHQGGDRGARRGRRRRWWAIGAGAVVGLVVVGLLFFLKLPYFVIQPGSVKPAEQRIQIDGARSYETPGRVMFVTVYINQATPALLIRSWLDDSFTVRTRKQMYPDGSEEQSRQENVILMDNSKLLAEKVALDYLGLPAEFTGRGALVAGLVDHSPSQGLLQPGDVVVEVSGSSVSMPADIGDALDSHDPGDTVGLVVERRASRSESGESAVPAPKRVRRRLEVALGADPKDPHRPVLGIYVEPYDLSVDSPIGVQVDSGDVGGPSAGLAWTLGIIDRLSPGSLTSGKKVAVTGEILADGTVGAVGGTPQKLAAVKRAGVRTFIYPASTPASQKAEIERIAGNQVKVHAVANIDEAVRVLAPEGIPRS